MNEINKEEKEKIFESFIKNHKQKFSDIEKNTSIQSNKLSYHLKSMVEDNLLIKDDELYTLSKKAEKLMPFFEHMTGKEVGNLCVVLSAIVHKDKNKDKQNTKIFLMKRKKRPYKGYLGLIGGKIKLEDSIPEASLREVKEETNLDCEFKQINAVLHERVREDGEYKHAFVLFLCTVEPRSFKDNSYDTEEGMVKWFDVDKLEKDEIIPSDYYMIKNLLDKKAPVIQVIQEDKDGKLVDMYMKNI